MLRDNEQILEKIREFKSSIASFIDHDKNSVEDIHTLRKSSRELLSLISSDELIYKRIKKIIKLSNKARDIDVFFNVYLELLPQKYISGLDIESIIKATKKSRKKQIKKLHEYLKTFVLPSNIKVQPHDLQFIQIDESALCFNQTQLHRYRIYIKKKLSIEKHSVLIDEKKLKILSTVKDILGLINDYYNGLELLKKYQSENLLFEEVESYTQEQQYKLFLDFKKIVQENSGEL